MDNIPVETWFPPDRQRVVTTEVLQRVGLTRIRAEYFTRLWIYLLVKETQAKTPTAKPPLLCLELLTEPVICTHREAANLFYSEKDRGSDRAAGLMLDKLAALGLIRKFFDGNTTRIEILPIPELLSAPQTRNIATVKPDAFDPRCDAIPVAQLLATNYNWMNRNLHATPHRIAKLLRSWSQQYSTGMRVLRRTDNQNPIGFCLLYPVASTSEAKFFQDPNRGLHFSSESEIDPFVMAQPGDLDCLAIYIRSWVIDAPYIPQYQASFLQDAQQILHQMKQDFPNACDLYSMIVHPTYEALAASLGFQKMRNAPSSIYWMYLALDRFLALDIPAPTIPSRAK
ncbi:hypothetical protein [Altericista sp. CCNU0014]|uniref:hypothetical protein n=1 Tax=Altericista sp. CCNU0014 TaxID=3082949 RepID=UPI00384AC7F9